MGARWLLSLVACVGIGCEPEVARELSPSPAPVSGLVETYWAGCEDYVEGACILVATERPPLVRVWVDAPPSTALRVAVDGQSVEVTPELADGGSRLTVPIPPGAHELTVDGDAVAGRLALRWHPRHPALVEALAARREGHLDLMCAALARLPAELPPLDRVAEIRLSRGCGDLADERRGEVIDGKAADLALASALPVRFVRAATAALSACLGPLGDLECAERWGRRLTGDFPVEAAVWANYSRGLLATRRGAHAEALELFSFAQQWAERLGMGVEFDMALEQVGNIHSELGRADAARDAAVRLYSTAAGRQDPCERARVINNAAWPLQVLAEGGLVDSPPLDWMLEEAEIYESGQCRDARDRAISRINLIHAFLTEGDLDQAEDWYSRALADESLSEGDDLAKEFDYLSVSVALATNRWEHAPVPLLAASRNGIDARMRWKASVQDAQVLERFGLDAAALETWQAAERVLDVDLAEGTVLQGRESFISIRQSSAMGLVDALLRADRTSEAMCRIRIARSRALRANDRRLRSGAHEAISRFDALLRERAILDAEADQDWSFPVDEQVRRRARRAERERTSVGRALESADAPGDAGVACSLLAVRGEREMFLAIFPTGPDTVVIAEGPNGSRVLRRPPIPHDAGSGDAWTEGLLAELAPDLRLGGVQAIRVMPVGQAWSLSVHSARWEGRHIAEVFAVTYGLDLPLWSPTARSGDRALIIGDPGSDLPFAEEEREYVHGRLASAGWSVESLARDAADRSTVLTAMAGADLLHYAGHGRHEGEDGWGSTLLLGRGTSVDAADVLAAPGVPRVVVLAGCETGAVRDGLVDGGMSLGRAFLLAGADAVVVGDRKVGDEDSLRFVMSFYDALGEPGASALATVMQRAYSGRAAAGASPAAWSGFRLLVR